MEAILEQLRESPKFPIYVDELQSALADERRRRQEFYEKITEDDKAEFINGQIIYQSPIRYSHSFASDALFTLLSAYVGAHDLGEARHEKLMISLTRNDYEPDICFFSKEKAKEFRPDQLHFPAPDFIVEVLSPSTEKFDRGVKLEDYAFHKIGEYWIVDPDGQTVEQYVLEKDNFAPAIKRGEGLLKSAIVPGFEIPLRAIFNTSENLNALKAIMAAAPKP
jgi:Uma2 family endonuclease